MKKIISQGLATRSASICWLCILMLPFQASLAQDQAAITAGEQIFQTYCFACHGIGEAQRIGPDLAGVHNRRSQDWLERFVKSPQAVIDSGDADAAELLATFNGMVMPPATISDQQITEVLLYIESRSSGIASSGAVAPATVSVAAATSSAEPPSAGEISLGGDLFQGTVRFENSGPACNACHDVNNDSVTGGGALATDLTSAYSRMGAAGLFAIVSQAPFPAMQAAYNDKPLNEEEIASLVAFFQYADAESDSQQATSYGFRLFLSGGLGAAFLFGLFPFIWRNRKVGSVNQSIYDRQDKTS